MYWSFHHYEMTIFIPGNIRCSEIYFILFNIAITTVEKLMYHLSFSLRAERRVGWGLKGAYNQVNSSISWRSQKTDW